jgi:hypothetical protein
MTPGLLPCTLRLNLSATFPDLTAVGISRLSSANPDRRFLLLEDFLGWLKVPSKDFLSKPALATLRDPSSIKPPTQTSVLSFNNVTRVLNLLSFSTLITSDGFVHALFAAIVQRLSKC